MNFVYSRTLLGSWASEAQSAAVAPKPWWKMTVAVCALGERITVGRNVRSLVDISGE